MNFINAVILGIVEGITEFLPISSTAHLIFTSKFLSIPQTDFQKFFEVFIQAGAILAVAFIYFDYVRKNRGVVINLIYSFIPTSIIGFLLYKIIKNIFFESTGLIIFSLFFIGLVFIILEYLIKQNRLKLSKSMKNISWRDAVIIGLGQAIAVVPGVSRSGIVMVTMMLMGYKRDESAGYSFMLAVPTILAASALDVWETRKVLASSLSSLPYLAIGFLVSLITAYISVKWLIGYLKNNSLIPFGIYRILLAILLTVV